MAASALPNGVVTYVHWMREELQRQGHRVSVFACEVDSEGDGIYSVRSSFLFRATRWWRTRTVADYFPVFDWAGPCAASVLTVHRRQPIDVIEMEESFGWFGDVARLTGIPTVVKLHGPAFMSLVEDELRSPSRRRESSAKARRYARWCHHSPARRTLEDTVARYALAPALCRHIVNPLEMPPAVPLWELAHCERKTVLFVGRFDQRKGGDLVLEAFARLLARDPELRLIFVGPDGVYRLRRAAVCTSKLSVLRTCHRAPTVSTIAADSPPLRSARCVRRPSSP